MKRKTDAPGLLRVKRPKGLEYWWSASRASKKPKEKEFRPRTVRLEETTEEALSIRCHRLTAELDQWMAKQGKAETYGRFDGTILSLNRVYETHPDSPYHTKSYATRRLYSAEAKVLTNAVGDRRIDQLTAADLRRWHTNFAAPASAGGEPRLRRAQGAMKALRRIASWGVGLRLLGCADLRDILKESRFTIPAARESAPTYAQILAFIDAAHEMGRPSLAMAAALMFDTSLRQTDVIGKWEPVENLHGRGGFIHSGRQWSGGVLWQDIHDGVLTKRTTKTGAVARFAICDLPLVGRAIAAVPEERRMGPMVIDERTGRPYRHRWFARQWREVARRAGIPDTIWSRDTRAGAITEAFDAGAELEHARQMATHSDPKVTGRYNRGSPVQTSTVAVLRARHRTKETK